MELKDYTLEELQAEIKRRKLAIQEEKDAEKRCRHCIHFYNDDVYQKTKCAVRTFKIKGLTHNYIVSKSRKACEQFKQKEL